MSDLATIEEATRKVGKTLRLRRDEIMEEKFHQLDSEISMAKEVADSRFQMATESKNAIYPMWLEGLLSNEETIRILERISNSLPIVLG